MAESKTTSVSLLESDKGRRSQKARSAPRRVNFYFGQFLALKELKKKLY